MAQILNIPQETRDKIEQVKASLREERRAEQQENISGAFTSLNEMGLGKEEIARTAKQAANNAGLNDIRI